MIGSQQVPDDAAAVHCSQFFYRNNRCDALYTFGWWKRKEEEEEEEEEESVFKVNTEN